MARCKPLPHAKVCCHPGRSLSTPFALYIRAFRSICPVFTPARLLIPALSMLYAIAAVLPVRTFVHLPPYLQAHILHYSATPATHQPGYTSAIFAASTPIPLSKKCLFFSPLSLHTPVASQVHTPQKVAVMYICQLLYIGQNATEKCNQVQPQMQPPVFIRCNACKYCLITCATNIKRV